MTIPFPSFFRENHCLETPRPSFLNHVNEISWSCQVWFIRKRHFVQQRVCFYTFDPRKCLKRTFNYSHGTTRPYSLNLKIWL
ncbi:hypothetical protein VIGAN_01054500 [Vigna angularis var. angularis]|uniref:Uncharacterized protein n=1 Tax=Vigna angularis var. angularis TaxID=157739 RepID=A0A0S3QXL5_PHAAN|nr:hypothetical protein VIGAN_01054500 [Vigna angularis var. angularis]